MRVSSENLIYQHRGEVMATIQLTGLKISEQSLEAVASLSKSPPSGYLGYCTSVLSENVQSYIPFHDIIWCQPLAVDNVNHLSNILDVTYVKTVGKSVTPITIQIQINDYDPNATVESLSEEILASAYKKSTIKPKVLVLVNPNSGKGYANQLYQLEILPILKAAQAPVTYMETKFCEHAMDIARTLDLNAYDIIACCSGDGIPHEFINGLYQRSDSVEAFNKLAITQLPCGSGNSMALSTHGTLDAATATFKMLKATRVRMDVMAVTQNSLSNEPVTKLSFLSQSYGVIADADIGTEHLRWMGPLRFDLGVAHKIIARTEYPCELYVDFVTTTKPQIRNFFEDHYQNNNVEDVDVDANAFDLKGSSLSENPPSTWKLLDTNISKTINVLYVGKMPYISKDVQFFPAAIPNDGAMDLVISGTDMSILEAMSMFNKVDQGKHVLDNKVIHAKIRGYRLVPKVKNPQKHYISVDGESFPFETLQVEVLPKVLTILLQDGDYVLTGFRD